MSKRQRPNRCKSTCRKLGRLVFSTGGLCLLVVGYLVSGAYMFKEIEKDQSSFNFNRTIEMYKFFEDIRATMKHKVMSIGIECSKNNCQGKDREIISNWLKEYQSFMATAISNGYYSGSPPSTINGWSTPSSLVFAATILTTIGYGQVTPQSPSGKLAVIFYALLAIPLMTMWLHKVVGHMRKGLKWFWRRITCFNCARLRNAAYEKRILKSKEVGTPSVLDDKDWISEPEDLPTEKPDGDEQQPTEPILVPKRKKLVTYCEKDEKAENKSDLPLTVILFVILSYLFLAANVFQLLSKRLHGYQHWTFLQSVYYCYVSFATIGFGDFVPGYDTGYQLEQQQDTLRLLLAIPFVIFGLALLLMCGQLVSETVGNRVRRSEIGKKIELWGLGGTTFKLLERNDS